VVKNAKKLAAELTSRGFSLVTGGTDNHLMVVDLNNKGLSGKEGEQALSMAGITVNKNTVPFDPRSPYDPSGIRLGTPAITTRGMKEQHMVQVADWIEQAIAHSSDQKYLATLKSDVSTFAAGFPLPH
jgi:glycine hydroxymethyltransferase